MEKYIQVQYICEKIQMCRKHKGKSESLAMLSLLTCIHFATGQFQWLMNDILLCQHMQKTLTFFYGITIILFQVFLGSNLTFINSWRHGHTYVSVLASGSWAQMRVDRFMVEEVMEAEISAWQRSQDLGTRAKGCPAKCDVSSLQAYMTLVLFTLKG